jgi:hypothetical protein
MTGSHPRPRPRCSACGSDDIVRDAWAAWDNSSQDWVLSAVFDAAWCNGCEAAALIARTHPDQAPEACP